MLKIFNTTKTWQNIFNLLNSEVSYLARRNYHYGYFLADETSLQFLSVIFYNLRDFKSPPHSSEIAHFRLMLNVDILTNYKICLSRKTHIMATFYKLVFLFHKYILKIYTFWDDINQTKILKCKLVNNPNTINVCVSHIHQLNCRIQKINVYFLHIMRSAQHCIKWMPY